AFFFARDPQRERAVQVLGDLDGALRQRFARRVLEQPPAHAPVDAGALLRGPQRLRRLAHAIVRELQTAAARHQQPLLHELRELTLQLLARRLRDARERLEIAPVAHAAGQLEQLARAARDARDAPGDDLADVVGHLRHVDRIEIPVPAALRLEAD